MPSVTSHPSCSAPRHLAALASIAVLATSWVGCQTTPEGSTSVAAPVVGLGDPVVVNRRDFVYALDFTDDAQAVSYVHHVSTQMELSLATTGPVAVRFQTPVNPSEFDVEDVLFGAGPARGLVITPSRDGTLRAFDEKTGALRTATTVGEPLVRVAQSPDGALIAASTAQGRVVLFSSRDLSFLGDGRVHDSEVTGLAFAADGRLLTTGHDSTLGVFALDVAVADSARVPVKTIGQDQNAFLVHLVGAKSQEALALRDGRQTSTVITRDAVKRLALENDPSGQPLPVVTSSGEAQMPAVLLGDVRLRQLTLGALSAAVCDACVPAGVDMVLGADALARASFVEDVARGEIVIKPALNTAADGSAKPSATSLPGLRVPREEGRISLPGPGTDLEATVAGVVVAFSATPAVRSFELYEAEKKGDYAAPAPTSGAALVNLGDLKLSKTFASAHRGFTVAAALSPDGKTVATGGWDKRVLVFDVDSGEIVAERQMAWLVRRVRFSPDGTRLGVAAWTPVNVMNAGDSEPSLVLYPLQRAQTKPAAP